MFYVDWELGGRKNFGVGIYFERKLRVGLKEANNFFIEA